MKNVELRLDHMEGLVRKINTRIRDILFSRENYVRTRAKKNNVTITKLRVLVKKLEHLEQALGSTALVRDEKEGSRTIMLFTQYERKRLRVMLAPDYLHTFRCSAADAQALKTIIDERRAQA